MTRRNYIWFSLDMAKQAIQSKERLEALSFCISVKALFVSSSLKKSDITYIMKTFRIGHIKAKRIVNNAIKFGYINISENRLHVLKIKESGVYNIKLFISDKSIYTKLDNVKK